MKNDTLTASRAEIFAIPMFVSKATFALLTREGAKEGKTAPEFLAEKLQAIVQCLQESKGSIHD